MKKKLFALILPFMMVGCLTGCNSGQYDEFCAKAADTAPLLLNSSSGKEIYASEEHVRDLEDYNSVLALNSYTFQQKELTVEWELLPAEKWVKSTYALDQTRYKLTPVYGKEDFETSIKCTVSYYEGKTRKGKTELSWKFNVAKTEVVEKTLKEINETYVANGNNLKELAKDEEGKDVIIGTRGYITATYEQPDHTYAGVFISDGEYSLQLYAGQISNLWKENNLKVGDCIFAVGPLSIYGVIEMKPTMMEPIDGKAYNIAEPVTIDATSKAWDGTLMVNQSSLIKIDECNYDSGLSSYQVGSHSSLKFKHGGTSVILYCSYHLGDTMMTEIKNLVGGYTAEDGSAVAGLGAEDKVTLYGVLTFSDSEPQIIPVFGVKSIVKPAA